MCQSPTSKKRRGKKQKKQKKTSTERRWNVSNLNKHFPPRRSRIEASYVGRLRRFGSPDLHITPTTLLHLQSWHCIPQKASGYKGVMLARQANKTAYMPLVRFPNPLATGSWGIWLTCHLPHHLSRYHLKLAYHLKKYKLKFLPSHQDQCSGLMKWVLESC